MSESAEPVLSLIHSLADTAAAKGMTPQDWCDSMEPAFRDAWDMLGITYTDFVRTTEPRHARTVQKFWQDLYDRGWCYKGSYEGWYCVHEETYYAESDLEKNEDGELVCPDCCLLYTSGGARAVPPAGTRPRLPLQSAHGRLHARLARSAREAALGPW